MDVLKSLDNKNIPIAVGGVGGSGTRLIASCLEEFNYYIGSDLNKAKDNLWFTLLFKHKEILKYNNNQTLELINIFLQGMISKTELSQHQEQIITNLVHDNRHLPVSFFQERAESLISSKNELPIAQKWAWKEPNTHIILDKIINYMPTIKYIHVVRNGLDMAYSANQNQQHLWGNHFIGNDYKATPFYSLKYWCIVHKKLLEVTKPIKHNFLLLNYDNFCTQPKIEIPKLLKFINIPINTANIDAINKLVKVPSSIGRFREFNTKHFDNKDIDFVENLGFKVE